jgi:hypothetical protein
MKKKKNHDSITLAIFFVKISIKMSKHTLARIEPMTLQSQGATKPLRYKVSCDKTYPLNIYIPYCIAKICIYNY